MAGAAAYMPHLQSLGCTTRKWNSCSWRAARITGRWSTAG